MATIRNTTGDSRDAGHVVHLVTSVSQPDIHGRVKVDYLTLPNMKAPGIPPTEKAYDIPDDVASKIRAHKQNSILLGSHVQLEGGYSNSSKKG